MTITMFSATKELAIILGNTVAGTATGGSATTLLDTTRLETDKYFTGGTLWFLTGNRANTSTKITDWDLATKTFTFATGAVAAAGNNYVAAPADYPREQLQFGISQAVRELPLRNITLLTVADQNEYTLPTGVYNLKHVEIAHKLTAPYEYIPNYSWQELEGKLVFDPLSYPTESDLIIRLTYLPRYAPVYTDAEALPDLDHIDALIWSAAVYCIRWRLQRTMGDQDLTRFLNEALVNAQAEAAKWPVPTISRAPHLSGW